MSIIILFTNKHFLQPAFVNNPLCGLLIVLATFLSDWKVGVGMVVGGSIATIGEMVGIDKACQFKGLLAQVSRSILSGYLTFMNTFLPKRTQIILSQAIYLFSQEVSVLMQ